MIANAIQEIGRKQCTVLCRVQTTCLKYTGLRHQGEDEAPRGRKGLPP